MKKEISKKATSMVEFVKSEVARYDSEKVANDERKLFVHTQNIQAEAENLESAILTSDVTNKKQANGINKSFIAFQNAEKQISIARCVKVLCACNTNEMLKKVFGADKTEILRLLKGDWCKRTYEALGIGKPSKTMLVFNLFRWSVDNNTRRMSITGIPTEQEIARLAENDGIESDEWRKKHACQVLVDVKSDTMEYTKYNKMTLAGLFYAQKKVTDQEVYALIQREFKYKAFLEDRKLDLAPVSTIKKIEKTA